METQLPSSLIWKSNGTWIFVVAAKSFYVTQFFSGDWNPSASLPISCSFLDLLIVSLSDSWSPKCRISSSVNLATCRRQLAMLTVLWTMGNLEHSLSKASRPGPNKPARDLWTCPEPASYAGHPSFRPRGPGATLQTHRANSRFKMELPFSHSQSSSDSFAWSGLASCSQKKEILWCSLFPSICSSVHFPNQKFFLLKTAQQDPGFSST